jgi:hypothetical protein
MKRNLLPIGATVLVLLLIAGGTWLWYDLLELRWKAQSQVSDAARENRLLAATRLLRQNGHPVALSSTLGELAIPKIADGTLIMSDANGVITPATAQELLAWVRRGNTLVVQPRVLSRAEQKAYLATLAPHDAPAAAAEEDVEDEDEDEDEDEVEADDAPATPKSANDDAGVQLESDPIGARFGVRAYWNAAPPCVKPPAAASAASAAAKSTTCVQQDAPLRRLALPGTGYWIALAPGRNTLVSVAGAVAPLWSDEHADTVRTYAEGRGRIVMLTYDFFDNHELQQHDHGELLLALAALNPRARQVTLVQHLNMLPWYQALWVHYRALLISLAVCALLCLWAAVRRFGPMLPQPASERRSLMEHIDASGAWLWKAAGGRQLLFDAAREETLTLVRRRAPKLARLPQQQLAAALARLAGLNEQHVMQALQQEAVPQVAGFTRQIRTLQELRNHYER